MESLLIELKEKGIDKFVKDNRLTIIYNNDRTLFTLNYSTRRNSITDLCRGLTLTTNNYEVVARGMKRFHRSDNGFKKYISIQSKEDGTLMMLYFYNNKWNVKCRFNFADDLLPYSNPNTNTFRTYEELFNSFHLNTSTLINPEYTYMIEMCSEENRIVRKYKEPKLFLLAAIHNHEESHELHDNKLDIIAKEMGISRPNTYNFKTMIEIKKSFENINDITFEGYVINTETSRIKVKNPIYLAIHTLKYKNWIATCPSVVHAIGNHFPEVIEILREFGFNDFEITEIIIAKELGEFPDLRNHKASQPGYCDFTIDKNNYDGSELASIHPKYENNKWIVHCVCGKVMKYTKLRRDYVVPSMCHCGLRNGIYKIQTGMTIYKCDCGITHEAKQLCELSLEQQIALQVNTCDDSYEIGPRGIPCNSICKIYRLHAHYTVIQYMKKHNKSKSDVYKIISNFLQIPLEQTHFSKFNIETCKKVIKFLEN